MWPTSGYVAVVLLLIFDVLWGEKKPLSQSYTKDEMQNCVGPLDDQTWQTEHKTAPLAIVQLCEYKNQTLEAFVVDSHLCAKFDCPVAHQNFHILSNCAGL